MPIVIFEGNDGCGKTTLAEMTAKHFDALIYSFPGKEVGSLGKRIYDMHHDPTLQACPEALQLLHITAHIDALRNRIIPWLEDGQLVVLDRFYWSTYVYGTTYGVSSRFLKDIINLELPFWGDHLNTAVLFYITRKTLEKKYDDPRKSSENWQRISELYELVFSVNQWDNLNRFRIENDKNIEASFNYIKELTYEQQIINRSATTLPTAYR